MMKSELKNANQQKVNSSATQEPISIDSDDDTDSVDSEDVGSSIPIVSNNEISVKIEDIKHENVTKLDHKRLKVHTILLKTENDLEMEFKTEEDDEEPAVVVLNLNPQVSSKPALKPAFKTNNVISTSKLNPIIQINNMASNKQEPQYSFNFICDYCGCRFQDREELSCHFSKKHIKNMDNSHLCSICARTFKTQLSFSSHMTRHRMLSRGKKQCPHCEYIHYENYLREHIQVKHLGKRWPCTYNQDCKRMVNSRCSMREHWTVVHGVEKGSEEYMKLSSELKPIYLSEAEREAEKLDKKSRKRTQFSLLCDEVI